MNKVTIIMVELIILNLKNIFLGCPALPLVNGSWSRKECFLRVQQLGERCEVKCHLGYLPYGFPNLTCTENGWNEQIPICLSKFKQQTYLY